MPFTESGDGEVIAEAVPAETGVAVEPSSAEVNGSETAKAVPDDAVRDDEASFSQGDRWRRSPSPTINLLINASNL